MEKAKKRLALIAAYFLIYVVWGSTYYFIGVALNGFPPFLLGALRFTAAGLLLLALCCCRKERVCKRQHVWRSAVSGIILLFIDMAVVMLAQRYVSSSLVAITASSTAVWILLFCVPMWKRNFRRAAMVAGIVSGFAGVGLLYFEQLNAETGGGQGEYGVLLLIGGCISWAWGTLYTKYCSCAAEDAGGFTGSAWQMLSAGVMFWICAVAGGDIRDTDFGRVSREAWFSLAYLISFGSILAYSAYIWLLKVRPAAEVATHAYVNPVVAVVIGVWGGGEQVSAVQAAGLVVILTGVVLVNGNIGSGWKLFVKSIRGATR